MTSHLVTTPDGTTIAADYLEGNDELILFLHGFTGRGSDWDAIVPAVRGERSALVVDLVGHGDSDHPDRLQPYEIPSVVDQVLSLLTNRDIGTVHLVGYSMGGRIALSMAARAPWFFASVTLISSSPGLAEPADREARRASDEELADRIELEGVDVFLDGWFALPLFDSLVRALGESGVREEKQKRAMADPAGLANSLRGSGTGSMPPLWHALSSIRSPVLCLVGEFDPKFEAIANRMMSELPAGELRRIPQAGHSLLLEAPAEISIAIRRFHGDTSGRMRP